MHDASRTRRQLQREIDALRGRVVLLEETVTQMRHRGESRGAASLTDRLTGLPNRAMFYDTLNYVLSSAKESGGKLAVIFFALDRFKLINDTLGQFVGDALLRETAVRLDACLAPRDTLCRPGRNEFLLLLPGMGGRDDAQQVVETIFDAMADSFLLADQELVVNSNMGICLYPEGGGSADALIRNAYAALLKAKDFGKNTHRFFSPQSYESEFGRLLLENDLRRAVNRQDFSLHYQPQVDLQGGRVVGVEALVRWEHQTLGNISPDQFIPLAEDIGVMAPLGEWVLRTACEHHLACNSSGCQPVRYAVNLSPTQLHSGNLVPWIFSVLEETGLDPNFLELEITEGALLKNSKATVAAFNTLHAEGVRIAIDDFGTGYSSLAYLSQFPISKLKIDKTFTSAVTTDEKSAAISQAIISLAHSLDMRVMAEGVETREQLDYLRDLECDEIQGYLVSCPLPADETRQFLARHSLSEFPL
ncbi:bifunctional diguanylate cyclase/phosphodiesterase [Oryzomonas japonica]|uniref:Bifunctional diguanylate cyclase/phosphodiesterase n=1 Tax=Oryzomonas japonica TaxID=2603858 RepID=A0A7J4ZMU5_9BACT|nr:bifunctional diguanylate cyclase/phosphodiesterase [Oryzomonas japonica]KAB0664077.1 bifunctional diguanylate cyclase/phosphodiesterase [Oryzomonas japonica]